MAKTKRKKASRQSMDDMLDGMAEGVTEQFVVANFKTLWEPLSPADKARGSLVIAALGAFGDSMVWVRDAFEGFKSGKMPKMPVDTAIPQLERAAVAYVIAMAAARKTKKTTRKAK